MKEIGDFLLKPAPARRVVGGVPLTPEQLKVIEEGGRDLQVSSASAATATTDAALPLAGARQAR